MRSVVKKNSKDRIQQGLEKSATERNTDVQDGALSLKCGGAVVAFWGYRYVQLFLTQGESPARH